MAYHQNITALFGADLFKLLGPKSKRVTWESLSAQEKRKRLEKIPVYVPTRSLGKHPTLVDIVIFCFNKLSNMGVDNPLLGIDLPEFESLVQAAELHQVPAMNYNSHTLQSVDKLYKNSAKQRDVFLRHIFQDIIFRFNPGLIFPGIGRMNSKGMLFVNDAQHRTLACIMLGIKEVPINYITSDSEYWDVSQYAAINIHSLYASEFDKFRIRVQRYIESENAGYPIDPDDELSYELHQLFEDLDITVAEKKDRDTGNSLVLTGIGNMLKYRENYPKDIFHRAVTLNAQMFPTSKFHTANSLGLMKFLTYQIPGPDNNLPNNTMQIDYAIMTALKKRFKTNNSGNQMHSQLKNAYTSDTGFPVNNGPAGEELVLAHGIYQLCKHYDPDIDWVEPTWDTDKHKHNSKYKVKMV